MGAEEDLGLWLRAAYAEMISADCARTRVPCLSFLVVVRVSVRRGLILRTCFYVAAFRHPAVPDQSQHFIEYACSEMHPLSQGFKLPPLFQHPCPTSTLHCGIVTFGFRTQCMAHGSRYFSYTDKV